MLRRRKGGREGEIVGRGEEEREIERVGTK